VVFSWINVTGKKTACCFHPYISPIPFSPTPPRI
jgi:hypothetical protein